MLIRNHLMATGKLVIIGGAEDRSSGLKILRKIVDLAREVDNYAKIAIVPAATRMRTELGNEYIDAFRNIGVESIEVLRIERREDAYNEREIKLVKEANVILFTGGDQLRLTDFIQDTPLKEIIFKGYMDGVIIAGTSAGGVALANPMIYAGLADKGLLKDSIRLTQGLGFIENVVIDTHFIERGRISRLLQIIAKNPLLIGVGLGENTAIILYPEYYIESIGEGSAIIVDGQNMSWTNIHNIKEGEPISLENVILHVLVEDCKYDLKLRTFFSPEIKLETSVYEVDSSFVYAESEENL